MKRQRLSTATAPFALACCAGLAATGVLAQDAPAPGDDIINPGNPGLPGGSPPSSAAPIFFDPDDPFSPPGGSPTFDYGDAPEGTLICGSGTVAAFPTFPGTVNASVGRAGPRHVLRATTSNALLGREIFHSFLPSTPLCDGASTQCDPFDDGALILCLTGDCESGLFVTKGLCGPVMGVPFGVAPPGVPQGFWLLRTRTGASFSVPTTLNAVTDWNFSGRFGDAPGDWILVDKPIAPLAGHSQLHLTQPFPVAAFFALSPTNWVISPFWTRFMTSDELVAGAFPSGNWDGSGTGGAYVIGETEDWIAQTLPNRWLCRVPESTVQTTANIVISLDLDDPECLNGVELTLTSSGPIRGRIRQFRDGALLKNQQVPVEIAGLSVGTNSPELGGQVVLRERSELLSFGVLDVLEETSGALAEGVSFFDFHPVIDLLGQVRTLDTGGVPVRIESGLITAFPPTDTPYQTPLSQAPVPLIDRSTLQQVGWLCVLSVQFTSATSVLCAGDANGDNSVNFADIITVLANWGTSSVEGDASADCAVDFVDIVTVLANWGNTCD